MSAAPVAGDPRPLRERVLTGDLYTADDPELAEAGSRALDLTDAYNATTVLQGPLRRQLLEELLGEIGEGTEIRPPLYVDHGSHHRIGARCFADSGLVALDVAPITIGDDVWLGGGAIVLPGVTIDESTVVGAGSVVPRDLPANVVAVGNPARVVRTPDTTGR
ncbi:maltose acetyltransferase domain-containing protein [Geodermatophilus sp. SYSU D00703]